MEFEPLLDKFCQTVESGDGQALAALFTQNGLYDDMFYGRHEGRTAISKMLDLFHRDGRNFLWEMIDPVNDGTIGYARWLFSYDSRRPENEGRRVVIEGVGCFKIERGEIASYADLARSGECLVSLGLPQQKISETLERWTAAQHARPDVQRHLSCRSPKSRESGGRPS